MKTENHSINDVLAKNATSFFIPPFQRAYAWGKPEIERYFYDVSRIIESEMDHEQRDKLEHFFGTVVIKEEKDGFASRSVVVDGQQRLTTTLLFLIALRDSEPNTPNSDYITGTYLTNNASTFEDKIKLKQVTKDWDAYRALINRTEPKPGIINNAYELLTKLINEKKRRNPQITFEQYLIAIHRMNVAVIFLDERPFKGEDPQIIFETLNSLGKPLTLSDLVRNFVLLSMDSNSQSDTYENVWHPKIEAVLGENASKFFRDYLQYKTASSIKVVSDNNTKEIYQLFKEFVEGEFIEHDDFINDIIRYVSCYKWIVTEVVTDVISHDIFKDGEIKELLRNIFHDIKSEAFKPFVLGLMEYHQFTVDDVRICDDTLISILTDIRTYLIRRRILGLTQGENKEIVLLSNRIKSLAQRNNTIFELLSDSFYRMRLPNDNEIKNALTTMNFYEGLKKYSKFILGKIEEHNTKVAVDFRNPKVTIEHVMPQTLDVSWKSELGDNFIETHKTYLHNIGNLILTEFNSEIGNKPFEEKKKKLNTSSLNFRMDIVSRDTWNERDIKEHQEKMVSWLLDTFNLPEFYREKNNWNTRVIERTTFSPLDDDAGDIAAGNKPSEINIDGKVLKIKTWQEVFLSFFRHLRDNPNYDFEFILDNQLELFSRDQMMIKWAMLKELIDEDAKWTKRYKTLNGKIWSEVKELDDDTLFIHINISSSTCLDRISRAMYKLNMSKDSVEIKLSEK